VAGGDHSRLAFLRDGTGPVRLVLRRENRLDTPQAEWPLDLAAVMTEPVESPA
jgi:hypothetical protein